MKNVQEKTNSRKIKARKSVFSRRSVAKVLLLKGLSIDETVLTLRKMGDTSTPYEPEVTVNMVYKKEVLKQVKSKPTKTTK